MDPELTGNLSDRLLSLDRFQGDLRLERTVVIPPMLPICRSSFRFSRLTCTLMYCLDFGEYYTPPVSAWRQAPPRRALPPLHRSYELMRQTSSLLRNSCIHTYFQRSLQVATSPCSWFARHPGPPYRCDQKAAGQP